MTSPYNINEMEIRKLPSNLQIEDDSISECPCCNNKLKKEIRTIHIFIKECEYCRYLDKPFSVYRNMSFLKGCSCEEEDREFLYIICEMCK